MQAYTNAVSDQLIVSVLPNQTVFQVWNKEGNLKWTASQDTQELPADLQNAIFSTNKLVHIGNAMTLAPLDAQNLQDYYNINHASVADLAHLPTDEFNVVFAKDSSTQSLSKQLVGTEEHIDIELIYQHFKDKYSTDAIFFYCLENQLTLLAWKDGQFHLANRFPADNLDELFYYVLLVVEQLDLSVTTLHFECIAATVEFTQYAELFQNYLAPLIRHSTSNTIEEDSTQYLVAHFAAQCVL